jgi:hypothetical protein
MMEKAVYLMAAKKERERERNRERQRETERQRERDRKGLGNKIYPCMTLLHSSSEPASSNQNPSPHSLFSMNSSIGQSIDEVSAFMI